MLPSQGVCACACACVCLSVYLSVYHVHLNMYTHSNGLRSSRLAVRLAMAISKPPNLQPSPNRGRPPSGTRAPGPSTHPRPSQPSGSAPPFFGSFSPNAVPCRRLSVPPPVQHRMRPSLPLPPTPTLERREGETGRTTQREEGGGSPHFSCSFPSPSDHVASLIWRD